MATYESELEQELEREFEGLGEFEHHEGTHEFEWEHHEGVLSALAPGGGYQSSWGTLLLVLGDEAECGARHVDQRRSGIGQSARRKAIAGSAAVTAASSSTSAVPAF